MPAYSPRLGVLATKLLTVYADNEAQGFPVHQAAIAVFDPPTGEMVALVNGDLLTAARTAACSALSIRHLARPGSRVLAVLGNGPRAREHARYACRVHHFTAVRIGARDPAKAAALAANLEGEGLPARGTTMTTRSPAPTSCARRPAPSSPAARGERPARHAHPARGPGRRRAPRDLPAAVPGRFQRGGGGGGEDRGGRGGGGRVVVLGRPA